MASISIKKLIAICAITICTLTTNAQQLAWFCDNEYGGTILKIAHSKIDSLKALGVQKIINLNHYVAHREGGYSKIIWKENENINGLIIEVDQVTYKELNIKTERIGTSEILWVDEFLEKYVQSETNEIKSVCDGWMSHQPYYLLYRFNNGTEQCTSLAQSDTQCNEGHFGVKLINGLKKDVMEFYQLISTDKERQNQP